ncbi:MAG: hypothetical protein L3J07_02725 [Candidatus Magasanikbacteria bacterium]|nr:hypothetical protein [Candidatus Magasanikbacteria bacterium]
MEIIGHKKIVDFFDKVLKNGRLGHAYLFVGQSSLGKKNIAEKLSENILKTTKENLKKELDFFFVEQEIDKKTGKTKKGISVDQIRSLINFLSQKSFVKGHKIAIIDNAHKMNSFSANALLKTLEEPRGKTVLFLISDNLNELPDTIISRCQVVYFEPVKEKDIHNFLISKGVSFGKAEEIYKISKGLPGKVLDFLENKENLNFYKKEIKRFESLFGKAFYEKRVCIEEMFGSKTDHTAQRDKIREILSIWQSVLNGFIYSENTKKNSITYGEFVRLNDKITEARSLILLNVHPRLLIENILLLIH